jgi:hypothetical protein
MQGLEKRIAVLEAVTPADPFQKALSKLPIETVVAMLAAMEQNRVFRMQIGESESDFRLRCGIPANATSFVFMQDMFVLTGEVRHAKH